VRQLEAQRSVLDRLVARLELDEVPPDQLADEDLWERAETAINDLVDTLTSSGEVSGEIDKKRLVQDTLNEALGLGPLEELLADENVEEIIVDRPDRVIIAQKGEYRGSGRAFSSPEALAWAVERLVAPTGHKIDADHPVADLRLRDGTRLTAAVPPVAVRGACLTLCKPHTRSRSLDDLVKGQALSKPIAAFLETCVRGRRNILVCSTADATRADVLGAIVGATPKGERVVSVEATAQLSIDRDEWIALEASTYLNGSSGTHLAGLVRGALSMRPDRLVADVRGAEALELVSALASACDGATACVTAGTAQAGLERVVACARLGASGASMEAVRELVRCAFDVVVCVTRFADGVTRVSSVHEVLGAGPDGIHTQELFAYGGEGFVSAGVVPQFYGELRSKGISADTSIF
jgi:pilus assembly protein CpaF